MERRSGDYDLRLEDGILTIRNRNDPNDYIELADKEVMDLMYFLKAAEKEGLV